MIIKIWLCILLSIVVLLLAYYILVITKRKLNQKDIDLENTKMRIFMQMSTENAQKEIDAMIEKYFGEYTLYNFVASNVNYIKKEDAEKGIKEITKKIILNISDVYIFYFKVLYHIEDEEQLLVKINDKVTELMLSYIIEYNKPKES